MPLNDDLEEAILRTVKRYSGRGDITPDQLIGKDIGITGSDSVQFLDELEIGLGIDLHEVVKRHTHRLPPNWLDRLLGKTSGRAVADLTVEELIDFARDRRSQAQT